MSKLEVCLYDSEPASITSMRKWLIEEIDCNVSLFESAEWLVRCVSSGYRPDMAIVETVSSNKEPVQNVIEAFQDAVEKDKALDVRPYLDVSVPHNNTLSTWYEHSYFGIGVLALLKAINCNSRVVYTSYDYLSDVIDAVLVGELCNRGVCTKSIASQLNQRAKKCIESAAMSAGAVPLRQTNT